MLILLILLVHTYRFNFWNEHNRACRYIYCRSIVSHWRGRANVTTNHRIVVPRGGSQQTIPARHLGLGDDVLCADGVQILTGVEHFYGDDDIYEIVLEPDANMGTFFFTDHQTGALLTRAKCWHANANRRGNSTRRSVVFPSGRFGVVMVVVAVVSVVVRIQKEDSQALLSCGRCC